MAIGVPMLYLAGLLLFFSFLGPVAAWNEGERNRPRLLLPLGFAENKRDSIDGPFGRPNINPSEYRERDEGSRLLFIFDLPKEFKCKDLITSYDDEKRQIIVRSKPKRCNNGRDVIELDVVIPLDDSVFVEYSRHVDAKFDAKLHQLVVSVGKKRIYNVIIEDDSLWP